MDMEMQSYSESINIISVAATMELAIENVCGVKNASNESSVLVWLLHSYLVPIATEKY